MQWKIEVGYKPAATDAMGEGIKKDIEDLGISGVDYVKTMQVYMIGGDISESDVEAICENLLTDRITQTYEYASSPLLGNLAGCPSLEKQKSPLTPLYERGGEGIPIKGSPVGRDDAGAWVVEVTYKPGVTDPVGDSTVKGIRDLGISGASSAKTGQKYIIKGSLSENDIEVICKRLLANDVIQDYTYEAANVREYQKRNLGLNRGVSKCEGP